MSANIQPRFNPAIFAEPVVIKYLADCPQTIPVLAAWMFDYWGDKYGMHSVQDPIDALSQRLYRNRIPLALVAMSGSRPVATASLKIQELATHKHFYHWLGSVFVAPEFRRRGIGSALVSRCEARAAEFGVTNLFLLTPDREGFYRKLNWTPVDRPIYHGMHVVVMKKRLAAPAFRSMLYYSNAERDYRIADFPRF